MSKDEVIKVRLLNNGGFSDLIHLPFPMDANAVIDEDGNGVIVDGEEIGVLRADNKENTFWFDHFEYELIPEEGNNPSQPEQHQTIEQLIAQMDTLADIAKRNTMEQIRLRDLIAARLNPLGYYLAKK